MDPEDFEQDPPDPEWDAYVEWMDTHPLARPDWAPDA